MKFKSRYYDQSFERRHLKYLYSLSGGLSLVCFGIITSYYYDGERPSGYSRIGRVLYKATNGLKEMDRKEILLAILVSIIAGLITMFTVDRIFSNRPVVVGLEVDEDNNKILFKLRKANKAKAEYKSYPQASMAYNIKKIGDGFSRNKYESLVFTKNFETIAVLYLNHEMWDSVVPHELDQEIEKIKLLTTRPISNS